MRKRKLGEGIEALEADRNALWDALDTLVYFSGGRSLHITGECDSCDAAKIKKFIEEQK